MRIVGGSRRGRRLAAPEGRALRTSRFLPQGRQKPRGAPRPRTSRAAGQPPDPHRLRAVSTGRDEARRRGAHRAQSGARAIGQEQKVINLIHHLLASAPSQGSGRDRPALEGPQKRHHQPECIMHSGKRDRAPELIRGSQGGGCPRPAFEGPNKNRFAVGAPQLPNLSSPRGRETCHVPHWARWSSR